jgi:hypothetical protein
MIMKVSTPIATLVGFFRLCWLRIIVGDIFNDGLSFLVFYLYFIQFDFVML